MLEIECLVFASFDRRLHYNYFEYKLNAIAHSTSLDLEHIEDNKKGNGKYSCPMFCVELIIESSKIIHYITGRSCKL